MSMQELLLAGCATTVTHRFTKTCVITLKNADLAGLWAVGNRALFRARRDVMSGLIRLEKRQSGWRCFVYGDALPRASPLRRFPVGPMTVATIQNTPEMANF